MDIIKTLVLFVQVVNLLHVLSFSFLLYIFDVSKYRVLYFSVCLSRLVSTGLAEPPRPKRPPPSLPATDHCVLNCHQRRSHVTNPADRRRVTSCLWSESDDPSIRSPITSFSHTELCSPLQHHLRVSQHLKLLGELWAPWCSLLVWLCSEAQWNVK